LIVGNTPGKDMSLSKDKVRAYKKFANKLWNISRFVFENTLDFDYQDFNIKSLSEENKKIILELKSFKKDIGKDIEEYRLYMAAEKGYHYVWHEFADKILESSKEILQNENSSEEEEKKYILLFALENILKMMHPFIPFVTEEIWKDFPKENKNLLMVEDWD
jgi:valyl-tRNA synthetase